MAESLLLVFVSLCPLFSVASVTGEPEVIGSHEPVKVVVGDDAILPCHLEPPFDVQTLTVEWRCNETLVHIYRHRRNDAALQNENYRGRTSLFLEEMTGGNISLKLTNVSERDEGNYTCYVPKLQSQVRRDNVTLIVEPVDKSTRGNQTDDQQDDQGGDGGGDEDPGISNGVIAAIGITIAFVIGIGIGILIVKRKKISSTLRRENNHQETSPESIQLNDEQNTS
ncbi:butyrophilin subfamily 2 member A2-like [Chaetodon auriga]|uniref:butyrophilin subfamily 2 member A2-like n=1 Tax=Chaetodon auriga TaxID=39042 RepID=UPI0040329894